MASSSKAIEANQTRSSPARPSRETQPEHKSSHLVRDLLLYMDRIYAKGSTPKEGRWTVYRVPENLRQVQKSAFVPKIISIGPLHRGDPGLRAMEEHKARYSAGLYDRLLEKCRMDDAAGKRDNVINTLCASIVSMEEKARACYSEMPDIGSNEFLEMMATDGCFVIELLRLFYARNRTDDPILLNQRMIQTLRHDLLLLENQLPFFVLEEIFELTSINPHLEPSLPELAAFFFHPILPSKDVLEKLISQGQTSQYHHLLHLFHTALVSEKRQRLPARASGLQDRQLTHCAVQLKEAGIIFQRRDKDDLLDIGYDGRVLKIPQLHIDDNSVSVLFNCLAFEQCHSQADPIFTNYLIFLDSLVNSKHDIRILQREGIISHVLGSDEDVAALVNRMGRGIAHVEHSYLNNEIMWVNDRCKLYYEGGWRMWWSNLMKTYFSNPWSIISLSAAIILLLLAALQTFYTVYPYYNPN